MIYTLTVNPSLDYIVAVDDFATGKVNRTVKETIKAGGKGINVSFVLKNLGFESTSLGFVAGFTGNEILNRIQEKGITNDFIMVKKGNSRINVKLQSNEETEINGMGPDITKEDISLLYKKLDSLKEGDLLVLSGSIPSTLEQSFYSDIMEYLKDKKVNFVVDATRELLMKSLKYKPFMVKPNNHELGEIFGVKLTTRDEVVPYAKKLQEMGAQNVLISMAGEGAVLVSADNKEYKAAAPKITLVNSVGAGDSMVAGFIAGFLQSNDYEQALKMGLCTGSASASCTELATKERVEALLAQL